MIARREFVTLLGSVAAALPVAAGAQQSGKLPTIGLLGAATASSWRHWVAAFTQQLRELGWTEGRSVAIEYRWAEGRSERYAEIAAEFVRLKVDIIVTSGGAVLTVKKATSTIPIVFAVAADPVGGGIVPSLARPGGNVTGLSSQMADAGGKKLELLRDVVPGRRTLAIMANVGYPASVLEMSEVRAAAGAVGLQVATLEIRHKEDIAPAFDTLKGRAEALYVCNDPLMATNLNRINTFALVARLPTMYGIRERLEGGGLMSYGPNRHGPLPSRWRLRRQNSAWCQSGRPPGRAADEVRSRRQPDHCEGAWPYRAAAAARPSRRGD